MKEQRFFPVSVQGVPGVLDISTMRFAPFESTSEIYDASARCNVDTSRFDLMTNCELTMDMRTKKGAEDEEPTIDDSVKFCPDCETPNQFGELCSRCIRDRELEGGAQ